MKLCALAARATSSISASLARGAPYLMFSLIVVANRTGSLKVGTIKIQHHDRLTAIYWLLHVTCNQIPVNNKYHTEH